MNPFDFLFWNTDCLFENPEMEWLTKRLTDDVLASIPKEIPMDDEGKFCKSFASDQVEEYKQFLKEYGYVVIRDVLTSEESKATIDDVWDYIEGQDWSQIPRGKVDRNDMTTWLNMVILYLLTNGSLMNDRIGHLVKMKVYLEFHPFSRSALFSIVKIQKSTKSLPT
jgi:hypothetical protein